MKRRNFQEKMQVRRRGKKDGGGGSRKGESKNYPFLKKDGKKRGGKEKEGREGKRKKG